MLISIYRPIRKVCDAIHHDQMIFAVSMCATVDILSSSTIWIVDSAHSFHIPMSYYRIRFRTQCSSPMPVRKREWESCKRKWKKERQPKENEKGKAIFVCRGHVRNGNEQPTNDEVENWIVNGFWEGDASTHVIEKIRRKKEKRNYSRAKNVFDKFSEPIRVHQLHSIKERKLRSINIPVTTENERYFELDSHAIQWEEKYADYMRKRNISKRRRFFPRCPHLWIVNGKQSAPQQLRHIIQQCDGITSIFHVRQLRSTFNVYVRAGHCTKCSGVDTDTAKAHTTRTCVCTMNKHR